jgi:hypothetical protein
MDEVSSYVRLDLPTARPPKRSFHLVFESHDGWNGLCADSVEKHEPVSDIDTAVVDGLKALDLNRPIREADIDQHGRDVRFVPKADIAVCPDDVWLNPHKCPPVCPMSVWEITRRITHIR